MADGLLPGHVKELMALVIAVVKQCDGCIAYHAKAAARRGVTSEEVVEALGVALLMDGGTATIYGPPRSPPTKSSPPNSFRRPRSGPGSGETVGQEPVEAFGIERDLESVVDLLDTQRGAEPAMAFKKELW